jgi:hypothetical protein
MAAAPTAFRSVQYVPFARIGSGVARFGDNDGLPLAGAHTSELLLSAVLVVRGAGLTTANIALMAGAFTGLPRDADHAAGRRVVRDRRARGAPRRPLLSGDVLGSVAFTALAVLPAAMLPGRTRREAAGPGAPGA